MPFSESDGHIAMTIELKFHSPIPDGLVLYSWISVAGINHEKTAALRFAKNRNHRLELERDRSNKQDPNAIEVVGCSNGLIRKYRDVDVVVVSDINSSQSGFNAPPIAAFHDAGCDLFWDISNDVTIFAK